MAKNIFLLGILLIVFISFDGSFSTEQRYVNENIRHPKNCNSSNDIIYMNRLKKLLAKFNIGNVFCLFNFLIT